MGRRLKGRIRLLQGLVLEVRFDVDCWSGKLGIGDWLVVLAAEMEHRL